MSARKKPRLSKGAGSQPPAAPPEAFEPVEDVAARLDAMVAANSGHHGSANNVDVRGGGGCCDDDDDDDDGSPGQHFFAIWPRLLPFQREGVAFAVNRRGRAMVCDEMGLGKTLQAIAIACFYERDWPVLIVCPASLKLAWAAEVRAAKIYPNPVAAAHSGRT